MNECHIMSLLGYSVTAKSNAHKYMTGECQLMQVRYVRNLMAPGHKTMEIAEVDSGMFCSVLLTKW